MAQGKKKEEMIDSGSPGSSAIDSLIADLGSRNGLVRQRARIALVHMGKPAVSSLIETLQTAREPAHWEAAKALSMIGDPESVQALVKALEDENFGIRWLAAEGLIAVGGDSMETLLSALMDHPESVHLQEGVHHVLHDLVSRDLLDPRRTEQVQPILAALNGVEPAVAARVAAYQALRAMRKKA